MGRPNGLRQPPTAESHALKQEGDLERQDAENRSNRAVG
jgi:hypothetical protein